MKRASADLGFIFIAYNLRRILNIVGVDKLIQLFGSFCLINRFKTLKKNSKRLIYLHYNIKLAYMDFYINMLFSKKLLTFDNINLS